MAEIPEQVSRATAEKAIKAGHKEAARLAKTLNEVIEQRDAAEALVAQEREARDQLRKAMQETINEEVVGRLAAEKQLVRRLRSRQATTATGHWLVRGAVRRASSATITTMWWSATTVAA